MVDSASQDVIDFVCLSVLYCTYHRAEQADDTHEQATVHLFCRLDINMTVNNSEITDDDPLLPWLSLFEVETEEEPKNQ